MDFLLGLLIFFAAIWLIFRLFGRQIFRYFAQKVMKQAIKNMEEQSRQYQRNYSRDPYHDEIQFGEEMEVKIPRNQPQTSADAHSIEEVAEDVEFEEFREKN